MKYVEAKEIIPDVYRHDWVEDRGGHYIIRVPDLKTFNKQVLDKPCIFLLGENSTVKDCEVRGFTNIFMRRGSLFTNTFIDATNYSCEGRDSVVEFAGNGGTTSWCRILAPKIQNNMCAVKLNYPVQFNGSYMVEAKAGLKYEI